MVAGQTETYRSWLSNVMDLAALRLMAEKESVIYEESLANLVEKHFGEVLAEINCDSDDEDADESDGDDDQ